MARKRKGFSEYRFKIEDFTPHTMPLDRLSEYLKALSQLFGHSESVHLMSVEDGSAQPMFLVNSTDEIKIRERLKAVQTKQAPDEAMRANKQLNELLREDNTTAAVVDPVDRKILKFPGRELNKLLEYGPFTQPDTVDGIPIRVGGEGDWVPVHLEDAQRVVHICTARRSVAKDIAAHLFTGTIRVVGTGRWLRQRDGEWKLAEPFRIKDFEPLPDTDLKTSIERLRAIPAKWKELDDPIGELKKIRHG
jgi:hypothetical protein